MYAQICQCTFLYKSVQNAKGRPQERPAAHYSIPTLKLLFTKLTQLLLLLWLNIGIYGLHVGDNTDKQWLTDTKNRSQDIFVSKACNTLFSHLVSTFWNTGPHHATRYQKSAKGNQSTQHSLMTPLVHIVDTCANYVTIAQVTLCKLRNMQPKYATLRRGIAYAHCEIANQNTQHIIQSHCF